MKKQTKHARSFTSSGAPLVLWLCGLLALPTLASCAPNAHALTREAGAAWEGEEESDAAPLPLEPSADAPDAASLAPRQQPRPDADMIIAELCGANPTLSALPGCTDAGITAPVCTSTACDAGPGADAVLELAPLTDAVHAATNSAVAQQALDGGGDLACQTDYIDCVAQDPTREGIDRCGATAERCGFESDAGPSIACSAQFAPCFLADLFAYDRCIAEFRACEAALSED